MNDLKLLNLTYCKDRKTILSKVNFTAESGQVTAILGPSGSGKSTLLKNIAGILNPTSGKILFNNKDVTKFDACDRKIGYVSQNPSLLPYLNIWQNISLGISYLSARKQKETSLKLLKKVGLSDKAYAYPKQLSIGQQQKVSILRALAVEPRILLFDEPYANLDLINKDLLINQSLELIKNSNAIKILITHNPYEAMIAADYVYVINRGKIVQAGSTEELFNNPQNEFVARIFGLANIITCTSKKGKIQTDIGNFSIKAKDKIRVKLVIRPDNIKSSSKSFKESIPTKIKDKKFYLGKFLYSVKPIDSNTTYKVMSEESLNIGDIMYIKVIDFLDF